MALQAELASLGSSDEMLLAAEALALATALAVFTPSSSGATALDRLARRRENLSPDEARALSSLRRAQFMLARIEDASAGAATLRDLASGESLLVAGSSLRADHVGVPVAGWLAPLGGFQHAVVGGLTPLDEQGLDVATQFVRPGRSGLVNPLRCAEAVFRHALRHGTPKIPGLNCPPTEDDDEHELDRLARCWAQPGAERDPEDVQFVRSETSLELILDTLNSAACTRQLGLAALSEAYAAIAQIQLDTLQRRAGVGSGSLRLDTVAAALEAAIARGEFPPGARGIFAALRRRLGAASDDRRGDAELDRLVARIQALRAKTVEQGCTEHEALAAAEKVAELLDRYGLSLSELDLRRQTCEGSTIETERKRAGPIDDCVPTIAAFFDCRVWGEKAAVGTLRYVFFGLPADVAAACYPYDLVEQVFASETALFRAGPSYADLPAGLRRTATNSFQIGLGGGIAAMLHSLREARETALRTSGRDLVVAKAGIVEAELAALGLSLRARRRPTGRRVLRDSFDQGRKAGLEFQYTPGLQNAG